MTEYQYSPQRFWAKIDKRGPDECWEWTAFRHPTGYGKFGVREDGKPRVVGAHRVAYQEAHGSVPDGKLVDHRCHTRHCVNPSHLRLATYKQNNENRQGARRDSASGVRGITWDKVRKAWKAYVGHLGRQVHVGYFPTLEEASAAVTAKRNELFTHNNLDRIAS